jgi:type II secretory pathway predicted ATPase ExeA
MPRWFNTAGPCQSDIHYMLSPTKRLPEIERLIEQRTYFVFHAPRQTGKTTAMIALAQQLTDSGHYTSVMVSVEVGSPFNHAPDIAEEAILDAWYDTARVYLPAELRPQPVEPPAKSGRKIGAALRQWAETSPRPLVLFIDEIDSLQNENLLSVLRQLRDGYPSRPRAFPHSLGLIGLRDVRDYKVASGGSDRLNTASPFNIKVKSLTLRDFNAAEVATLYGQHTLETGQVFTPEAIAYAFKLTQGQPWLVNALAKEIVEEIVIDPSQTITVEDFQQAKEILIQRRDTHLDSLAERLREPRVRAIIEPMLSGKELGETPDDDRQFLVDLGLVRRDPEGGLVIANPIYREVIPRVLTGGTQDSLPRIAPTWLTAEGELDSDRLLDAFLAFWRQHGEPLLRSASYHEIAPHIVLMAFLHRVVNGGGTLDREYAIGSDRMDICLRYGKATLGMELKVWRDNRSDPLKPGLNQLDSYLARLGLATGWLVIFDQRSGRPAIEERTTTETASTANGRPITVIRA